MASVVINTRADLESINGTAQYQEFMNRLKGSMTRTENQAVYPDGYSDPDYDGPTIEPVWVEVEDLTTIKGFGFVKSDF
jgi:hypothetical protein